MPICRICGEEKENLNEDGICLDCMSAMSQDDDIDMFWIWIKKMNETDHEIFERHYGSKKPEPKKRGVKKGTKRGSYKTKKRAIKGRNEITFVCKQCGRKRTYIRKGKRLKEFCNNACKQKYYRQQKLKRELQEKMG